jgi:hypothetical protein
MAELKTRKTTASVDTFLKNLDAARRAECTTLVELMKKATSAEPRMWGPSIVGFGDYRYKYDSGREGEWFAVGFSPRKSDLTLYIMPGINKYRDHLANLGRHRTGKSCLYIKRLADVDLSVLTGLVNDAVTQLKTQGK